MLKFLSLNCAILIGHGGAGAQRKEGDVVDGVAFFAAKKISRKRRDGLKCLAENGAENLKTN